MALYANGWGSDGVHMHGVIGDRWYDFTGAFGCLDIHFPHMGLCCFCFVDEKGAERVA